jgi:hypothetical protein
LIGDSHSYHLQTHDPFDYPSFPYFSQTRFSRQIWRLSCLHIALERCCSVTRSSPKTTPMQRPRFLRKLPITPLSHIFLSSRYARLIMFSGTAHLLRGFSLPATPVDGYHSSSRGCNLFSDYKSSSMISGPSACLFSVLLLSMLFT